MRAPIRLSLAFLLMTSPATAQEAQEFSTPGWYVMITFVGGYDEPYPKEVAYGPYASQTQCEEEGISLIPDAESLKFAVTITCEYLDQWTPSSARSPS